MKLNSIRRVVKEGFINILRNRLMTMAAITAIVSTLLILGIVLCMVLNINAVMSDIESNLEITIFIESDVSEESTETYAEQMASWDGVNETLYTSAAEALAQWRSELGEESYILEGYDENNNPVPASIVIVLESPDQAESIVAKLEKEEYVKSVRYNQEFIDTVSSLSVSVHIVGGALLIILATVSMVVTMNTIRMSIYSRRYEINIMKYVGATNGYIRRPFVFEGVTLGLIAAIIAYGIVLGGYLLLLDKAQLIDQQDNILGAMQLLDIKVVAGKVGLAFIGLACGVSGLSSFWTTRKHLNV
jgi:cell division transport system permease protein